MSTLENCLILTYLLCLSTRVKIEIFKDTPSVTLHLIDFNRKRGCVHWELQFVYINHKIFDFHDYKIQIKEKASVKISL